MDILEAVSSRYSCRAFLPTPVPEKVVRQIVERAARAPSAGNMQPWRVYAIAGNRVDDLKALLAPRMATELPKGEGTDYTIYPRALGGAISVAALHGRRTAVPVDKCVARRQVVALRTVCAQLSVFRRAGCLVLCPRNSSWSGAMGRHRRLSSNRSLGGARIWLAYLSAAGVGVLPSDRAHFFASPRQSDDLFGNGSRIRRPSGSNQFLALSA